MKKAIIFALVLLFLFCSRTMADPPEYLIMSLSGVVQDSYSVDGWPNIRIVVISTFSPEKSFLLFRDPNWDPEIGGSPSWFGYDGTFNTRKQNWNKTTGEMISEHIYNGAQIEIFPSQGKYMAIIGHGGDEAYFGDLLFYFLSNDGNGFQFNEHWWAYTTGSCCSMTFYQPFPHPWTGGYGGHAIIQPICSYYEPDICFWDFTAFAKLSQIYQDSNIDLTAFAEIIQSKWLMEEN